MTRFFSLNTRRSQIFKEIYATGLLKVPPPPPYYPKRADKTKWCEFHRNIGHTTDDCWTLLGQIEELIRRGYIQKYVLKYDNTRRNKVTNRRSRSPNDIEQGGKHAKTGTANSEGLPIRGTIDTISGGFSGGGWSSSSRRRYCREVMEIGTQRKQHPQSHLQSRTLMMSCLIRMTRWFIFKNKSPFNFNALRAGTKAMPLSTTASSPSALEEGCLPHDGDGYELNDDGASCDVVSLDEEGFPSQVPGEDGSPNRSSEKSSFAADFYHCGTDWSSLSLLPEHRDLARDSGKKLKQANLFQIWGFERNGAVSSVESEPNQSGYRDEGGEGSAFQKRKIGKPGNWGSILRDTGKAFENPKSSRKRKDTPGENRVTRACPFYKKIPGTTFTVDAFRYGCVEGCSAYFLSHFHCDHYGGLSKKWSHGPIYCSPLTGRLVQMCLSVNPLYIYPLEFNTKHVIDGIKVTLLEANHCPGAALIHFDLPNGQSYLHTGDFRACKQMRTYDLLVNKRVNVLYLDTTYCNPKYQFPSKEDVLNYVVKITKNHLKMHPRTLVVVGAYSIGKECVYLAISKALGVKIYANASRRRILLAFGWRDFPDRLCTNGNNTLLHILPMSSLRFETLKEYLKTYKEQFSAILAFRPTGWTFNEKIRNDLELIKPVSKGNITIYGVPYSEHSSFTELRDFVQFLRPDKIIPTVNVGNAANREKMQSYFRDWLKG